MECLTVIFVVFVLSHLSINLSDSSSNSELVNSAGPWAGFCVCVSVAGAYRRALEVRDTSCGGRGPRVCIPGKFLRIALSETAFHAF